MTPLQATVQLSPPFVRGVATFRRLRLQAALAVSVYYLVTLHFGRSLGPILTLLKTRKLDAGASVTRDEFRTPRNSNTRSHAQVAGGWITRQSYHSQLPLPSGLS